MSVRPAYRYDSVLLLICSTLLAVGYVMVCSASLHLGAQYNADIWHYPVHQLIHIVLGLVVAFGVMRIKMEFWQQASQWLVLLGLLLLGMVLVPGLGVKVNGSVRWLSVGGLFRIQVSEIVKLLSALYIAGYVSRYQQQLTRSVMAMLKALLLFSLLALLLLMEPDFGSAVVVMVIALGVMFLAGARIGQFVLLLALCLLLALALIYYSPYRWQRVTSFINPWADPLNSGFQLTQALIAFGRGEWFGVGLGSGIQKMFYLPEAHTDFLFSVLAEELGLFGVLLVIVLFSLLFMRAFVIGYKAEQAGFMYSAYLAYGLGIWFGFQSFVNMGVNMGILPTKGLTLPLMSYGGGSMIVMCIGMALLFRIAHEVEQFTTDKLPRRKPEWLSV